MNERVSIQALLHEARQAIREKDLDRAGNLLERAIEIDPDDIPALDLLGFVRFFQKRYSESEICCHKVLAQKPDHAYALSGLGMNRARQGALEEGIESLNRAIAAAPTWCEPYWDLAVILKDAGRYDDASRILKQGVKACPENAARFEKFALHIETLKKK
jgi:Flp pilus assembly protein TadD